MGLFEHSKDKETSAEASAAQTAERKPYDSNLIEIAKLIAPGDEAVLRGVTACAESPAAWYDTHQEQYSERCIDSAEDLELIQWIGLVDILEEHGWVCERDWKDELEDFLYFVEHLHGFQKQELSIDPDWFDEGDDIPVWCGILTEKWGAKGVRMAAVGIDSDSYVLFPCAVSQYPALRKLAAEIGQCIEFVD